LNKWKFVLVIFFFIVVGCTTKKPNPDALTEKLFTLNRNTAIIDVSFGKVDKIDPTISHFWGSKRNTENSAIDSLLNELNTMNYSEEKLMNANYYYLFIFDGQMIEDKTDTFEIYLYINPDNYSVYLEKIELSDNQQPVMYNRLYQPNDKIRQYVNTILESKQ
jgi:hypothetical protein